MDRPESVSTSPSRSFWLRSALVLVSIAVFIASVAFVPSHGLVRTSIQDGTPTYSQPNWAWPYMDGAGFGFTDLSKERTDLVFEGVVQRPSKASETWRIKHHGAVEVWLNGEALLNQEEPAPQTVTEVTARWEGEFADLRVVMHPTRKELQRAPHYVFSIESERAFGGWHLLAEERLYGTEAATADAGTVKLWVRARALSLLCLLGVCLASFVLAFRRACRAAPACVGVAAAVFVLALIVRAIVLDDRFESDGRLWSLSSNGDNYVLFARQTLAGGPSAVRGAYFSPGNTWWIMGVTSAIGPELWKLYWLNVLLGSSSLAALSFAAARVRGVRLGALVGLIGCIYGPLVFFHTSAQIAAVATSAMAFLLASVLLHFHHPTLRRALYTGFYLGAAALTRPTHIFLAPILFAAFLLRRRWKDAGLLTLGTLCLVLPQTALNATSPYPTLISANGPVNFLLGNNTDATGDYSRTQAFFAARADARQKGESLMYATAQEIQRNPLRAAELFLRKCSLIVLQDETDGMISYPKQGLAESPFLRVMTGSGRIGMAALAWLALFGAAHTVLRRRSFDPFGATIAACAIAFSLGTAAVFVNARIRSPLIPLLIVLAGLGLDAWISRRVRGVAWWRCAALATVFMVGMTLVHTYLPRKVFREALPADAITLTTRADSGLELLAYRLETEEFIAGRHIYLTLFWRANTELEVDHEVRLSVMPVEKGKPWASARSVVGTVGFPSKPTSTWKVGDILEESYNIPLRRGVKGDVRLFVAVEGIKGRTLIGEERSVAPPSPLGRLILD